jgi:hypothetical protein
LRKKKLIWAEATSLVAMKAKVAVTTKHFIAPWQLTYSNQEIL